MQFPGHDLPPKPPHASRSYPGWARLRAEREAAFAKWAAEERERVERQRAAFRGAFLGPDRKKVVDLMLDRAWTLLDAGEAEAADALLEFVPETEATALLDEFFDDEANGAGEQ